MRSVQKGLAPAFLLALTACQSTPSLEYPEARRSEHVDVYHGVRVADPYRWLEDPDSAETKVWVDAQNVVTRSVLDAIPEREELEERLTELWDYQRFGTPVRRGGRTFFTRNDGLQDQSVLWVVDAGSTEPRVLLDPNEFSDDNTIALANWNPSKSGDLLAYATSDGGSDWRTWYVLDVATGEPTGDVLRRNKFGGLDWTPDETGLIYTRYPAVAEGEELQAKNLPPEICLHVLGTSEEQDRVLQLPPEDPNVSQGFAVSENGTHLILSTRSARTRMGELWLAPFPVSPTSERIPVATGFDAQYGYVGDDGETAWIRTNLDAPRGRVLAVPIAAPARENWRELIPESPHALRGVSRVGNRLLLTYLEDAKSSAFSYHLDGSLDRKIELPGIGSVSGFGGEATDTDTFYSFTSYLSPASIYRYDLATGKSTLFREPNVDFDPSLYTTRQVFFTSKDGTRVPMFLTHAKDLELDGTNPTYLYGYGGFNISLTPSFSVANLVWIERGGVLAIPNLRGGGEYGEAWHEAGTKLKKQNVFDDFLSAAHWLIDNRYTRPDKLAIAGGSNGGLLVGAAMTQEPDLFGAALPAVGVMDMLRYHQFTIGWAWAGDYGTSEDPEEFEALLAYSPLHNLERGTAYPATMVTTADHDDRVVPAHSFKFAAELQHAHRGSDPVLIRIETRAGHGAGKPTKKRIEEAADRWAFLVETLDAR